MPNGNKIQIIPYHQRYQAQALRLAHEMHDESPAYSCFSMDDYKLISQFRTSVTMPDSVYLRLAMSGDEVIGGLFGVVVPTFFSDEHASKDMGWFVKKDRRGSIAAILLLADFEQWAMERGVYKFFLGQSTGVNIEATAKLYKHMGYCITGVNAFKIAAPNAVQQSEGDHHV